MLPIARPPRAVAWRRGLMLCLLLPLATSAPEAGTAQESSGGLPEDHLLLLRESFNLVSQLGSDIWPGWANAPLTVLVIEEESEFLVNPPAGWDPSGEFELIDQTFIGRPIYRRSRSLPSSLRAAFPVVGAPAAIVGGWRPREESPNEWAMTLAHEWFHVLQMARGEDEKLRDLALGDVEYPSLQLDYPFAYGDRDIDHAIHLLGQALYDFWNRSRDLPRAMQRSFVAETSWAAMKNLETVIRLKYGDEAYNYFRYQTWKEGVARYTQVQLSLIAADRENRGRFRHVPGFGRLPGMISYARLWEEITRTNYWMIRSSIGLGGGDPTTFYGIGHGIAELLDVVNPGWKERYFEPDIWLDDLFAEIMESESLDSGAGRPSSRRDR